MKSCLKLWEWENSPSSEGKMSISGPSWFLSIMCAQGETTVGIQNSVWGSLSIRHSKVVRNQKERKRLLFFAIGYQGKKHHQDAIDFPVFLVCHYTRTSGMPGASQVLLWLIAGFLWGPQVRYLYRKWDGTFLVFRCKIILVHFTYKILNMYFLCIMWLHDPIFLSLLK